jgi:beta-lactamase regulating signal transducer with metallopeptidase domain
LALRRRPEVLAVPGRLPPLIVPGWTRPRLLLPTALLGRLTAAQREAMLLHELLHLKGRDHWIRILELVVGVAYWWLPGIGWIGRQLRGSEESCCDAAVVAHLPQARRDYARLLLDVVDFAHPLPGRAAPQATAMSARDLEQRLRAILHAPPQTRRLWPAGALVVGLACAVLPCELHYRLGARGVANAVEREPSPEQTELPPEGCGGEPPRVYCCPS